VPATKVFFLKDEDESVPVLDWLAAARIEKYGSSPESVGDIAVTWGPGVEVIGRGPHLFFAPNSLSRG
jgi:hypothetical protein